jgi:mevalonate pyrophosphate decarboxylase
MKLVKKWREEGLKVYFTINTGQNIHLLCEKPNVEKLVAKLKNLPEVKEIIINTPAVGARITDKHLF